MSEHADTPAPTPTRCARCGTLFGCGAALDSCWCQTLPPLDLERLPTVPGCYCPDCLAALVADQQASR